MYNYDEKGRTVMIRDGAHAELVRRGWDRGVDKNHDGELAAVTFEFGRGTGDHHFEVTTSDGAKIGYPPEFLLFT